MRKSLAAIAGFVLILSACTTAGSSDTTALETAAPETTLAEAAESAPPPTTAPPATATAPTTTVVAPAPTTTTTVAPAEAPTTTKTTGSGPEPILTRQAALTDVTITMTSPQTGEGPITIWVEDPGDLPIQVTLSALATPEPFFNAFLWVGAGSSFLAEGNPNVQSFDLTIPTGQQSRLYTIIAGASGPPFPLITADEIEILLIYYSDLWP